MFDLTRRVAIVTGGARGIGLQFAHALAEAGADIVVCSRNEERCATAADDLRGHGVRALPLRCDVTDVEDVRAMVAEAVDEFHRIDILINNAGRVWAAAPEDMPVEEWRKVIDVNLTGAFLCSQAAGRVMIAARRGKIINVVSGAGRRGVAPEVMDAIAYNASKGGLITFTRDLAVKWARHSVHVNAIEPGWFPTDMSRLVIEGHRAELESAVPFRRLGGEDDLKGAVVFLASDASDFVTGHVLAVDGGMSAW